MILISHIFRKLSLHRPNFARTLYSIKKDVAQDPNYLARQIYQKIKAKGPITIADYMNEVLTNPVGGYYMHKNVLGEKGDFITSPEISQMFGEIIAVWLINEWQKMGSPKPLQIVELGPGRGYLASDILKVFSHFQLLHQTTLHLVEVSPYLSEIQAKKLCRQSTFVGDKVAAYRHGISNEGILVNWYKHLSDIPRSFTLFVAHEFFDAIPIHKFHKTHMGYNEVLIDIDPACEPNIESQNPKFRYILARNSTPIQGSVLSQYEKRDHIEVSPKSMIMYKEICERIKELGGLALICDYGHDGSDTDTFRAFRKHQQVDPLDLPGSADLTADVDFNVIRQIANQVEGVLTLGPTTQHNFLLKCGLDFRVENLKKAATDKSWLENINDCYKLLTDKDKMGERFKFMALTPETMKRILKIHPMVGFSEK